MTAVYAAALVFISAHHEVWGDEVGVFSIVRSHPNFFQALPELKPYGHPFLWYFILWCFHSLLHASIALKAAQIAVAVAAIWVFISRSPFSLPEKLLFVLGYFPLYEYAVISRNYGVSMLMLFAVASLYTVRFERMILYSVAIFFFAQTHALSWIIALVMTLCLATEVGIRSFRGVHNNSRKVITSFFILTTGLLLSIYCIFPAQASRATHFLDGAFSLIQESVKSLWQCFYAPPKIQDLFGIRNAWVLSGLLWVVYALLFRTPILLILFLGSFWAFNFFFDNVYFGAMRHYGFLYILLWAVFWMQRGESSNLKAGNDLRSHAMRIVLMLLALPQIAMGYQAIEREIKMGYSSSRSAAAFIKIDPALEGAIVISEPPEHAESLPYYAENPLYFPREKRFGVMAGMNANALKSEYSLGELLKDAQIVRDQHQKPVVILLEPGIAGGEPGQKKWAFGSTFSYSRESLDEFSLAAKKIAGFYGSISGENYELFLIPMPDQVLSA